MVALNYEQDIAAFFRKKMCGTIHNLTANAETDLLRGPLYLNATGYTCSPYDDGAKPFDFVGACSKISEWCNQNIVPVYVEPCIGYVETDEPEYEYMKWSEHEVKRIVFGKLSDYL